jgi:hypothetical protein
MVNWIGLSQDRVRWQAFMNTDEPLDSVMKAGYCLTS